MTMRFHNTRTRKKEVFEPRNSGAVGLYTCGPTVYDFAHIGNFRAYVWEDLLRRTLEATGYKVHHVMNLTDVDDKTILNSAKAGVSLEEYTRKYIDGFFADMKALNVLPAHEYPRATQHVEEMVALVERLREKGHTYESQGSIYFRIDTFPNYGVLSGVDPSTIRSGESVDSDEYEKEDVRDFVLWKAAKSGEPSWNTRLGVGRPGWHLECSAMSMKYLGESFDIHTGGADNIFPHHENEIAQSEAATDVRFVNYWLHCAHLIVDGKKMSKSEGNYHTLRDLLERGHSARAIRYLLLSAHYRKQLNFTMEGIEQASVAVGRLDDFRDRVAREQVPEGSNEQLRQRIEAGRAQFHAALEDDLNSAGALGALFELLRDVNAAYDEEVVRTAEAEALQEFLQVVENVLGLGRREEVLLDEDVEKLIEEREAARKDKDFARSDAIRDELKARGILLEDCPTGVRWKRG
ncbi:MAG: cysteine--tRNA ligase [Acidobacteria bacterium]|nr:MAG: cysteine--tRNA ligase [Acidobacteriota bacterium]